MNFAAQKPSLSWLAHLILGAATVVFFAAGVTSAQEKSTASEKPSVAASKSGPAIANPSTEESEHVVYEISRLRSFDDERLPAALIIAAAIALVAVVWQFYRRDAVELGRGTRLGVILLRCLALAGLIVFFLGIERRTTREVVHNSQVAVLVDVSQSMGLSENENAADTGASRIQYVVDALAKSPLISDLRKTHDVNIARFDQEVEPVVSLPKIKESQESEVTVDSAHPTTRPSTSDQVNWSTELQARGPQTRLGQALADELRLYHDAPLAGIVVISDGAQKRRHRSALGRGGRPSIEDPTVRGRRWLGGLAA